MMSLKQCEGLWLTVMRVAVVGGLVGAQWCFGVVGVTMVLECSGHGGLGESQL